MVSSTSPAGRARLSRLASPPSDPPARSASLQRRVLVRRRLVERLRQQRHHDHLGLVALQGPPVGADVLPAGDQRPQIGLVEVALQVGGQEARPGAQHRQRSVDALDEPVRVDDPEPGDHHHGRQRTGAASRHTRDSADRRRADRNRSFTAAKHGCNGETLRSIHPSTVTVPRQQRRPAPTSPASRERG